MSTNQRPGVTTAVYLEAGQKRVFACSYDWPGWARSGRTGELAIEALAAYAPRYAVVAEQAGFPLPATATDAFDIVERLPGNATTDFGAPGQVPERDSERLTPAEAERLASLVDAAWVILDLTVARSPAHLRKGPRGGGRDRDKMVAHVLAAESAYARKIGIKLPVPDIADTGAIMVLRTAIIHRLNAPGDGASSNGATAVSAGWPVRYAARRIAWHVLDHAWEMQDRDESRST
jgi:hypothetical protein